MRKIVALAAGVAAALVLVAPAGAAPNEEFTLPAPTGQHPVGQADLHLVDRDRPDPWVPAGPRELMISMWYPAAEERGDRAPYATAEESRLLLELYGITGVPQDALARVRSHARVKAPPLGKKRPLIVLSPGFVFQNWTLTSLAEELASRGYVVAGIDHTYEASAVTFPDGRVVECVLCKGDPNLADVTASRARDISFVLDSLPRHQRYGRMIDPRRIAVVGHSIGGASAATTMVADRRVDAGLNMDGSFVPPLTVPLPRPFLMLGADVHGGPGRPDWDTTWTHLTGWRRWLHVPGMGHVSPSDVAVIGEWLGLPGPPLPGPRIVEIVRTYVTAFAEEHLRHRHQPLLDGPSPQFPEVSFVG